MVGAQPPYTTTFIATFSGDAEYAPATVSRIVPVRALVSETLSGCYRTERRGGGETYRLFHHSKIMKAQAFVVPTKVAPARVLGHTLKVAAAPSANGLKSRV